MRNHILALEQVNRLIIYSDILYASEIVTLIFSPFFLFLFMYYDAYISFSSSRSKSSGLI